MQGTIIDGKYEIVRLLGQGGMGAVYEARHLGTSRRVALKVIVSELVTGPEIVARFQREARASGSIDSQHVVQMLDTGIDPASRNPYMVMEYMAGEDLSQLLEKVGPVAPELALRLVAQACLGLGRAHEVGIVHRDIKSANLYLARREGTERIVKILDFGIARIKADQYSQTGGQGLTRTGSMIGSPLYMSPEQALGAKDLDNRSDLWSLGVVLYELLGGTPPHAHCETIGQLLVAIASKTIPPLQDRASWVTPQVAAVVHKAMAQDRADRFQTAYEMHAALMALVPGGNIAVDESMLVSLHPTIKGQVAPRLQTTGSQTGPGRHTGPAAFNVTTAAGVTGSRVEDEIDHRASGLPPPRSAWVWAVPAAVVVLGMIGAGAYVGLHKKAPIEAQLVTAPITPASVSVAPQTERTSQVTVAPAGVQVTIDGVTAVPSVCLSCPDPTQTKVDIHGALGSVHTIKLRSGSQEASYDVTISDMGAVPPRVALDTSSKPSTPAGSQRPVVGTTTHLPTTASPSATTPPPLPSAGTKPKGAPSVDRSM